MITNFLVMVEVALLSFPNPLQIFAFFPSASTVIFEGWRADLWLKSTCWTSKRTKVCFSALMLGSLQLPAYSSVIPWPLLASLSLKTHATTTNNNNITNHYYDGDDNNNGVFWKTHLAFINCHRIAHWFANFTSTKKNNGPHMMHQTCEYAISHDKWNFGTY